MKLAHDEYGWVKLSTQRTSQTWKLVRGSSDTNYGMLSKWALQWVVFIYGTGELVAELPRTLNSADAKAAAKLILLSLKQTESEE
jgi:hypothetical protein